MIAEPSDEECGTRLLAPAGSDAVPPDGMCTAGGRVREGNPPWYGQV